MAVDRRATLQAMLPPFWRNLSDLGGLSDDTNMSKVGYGVRSAVAGTIKVTNADGSTATMQLTAGETRPAHIVRVWDNGTVTIAVGDLEIATQD